MINQAIRNPVGVSVFGSSIVRVEPDSASLNFSVSRLEKHPKNAFRQAREAAKKVQDYLSRSNLDDYGSSRITLDKSTRYENGEHKFIGYTARITFNLLLRELERVEEILIGITDAGVNNISSVDYQTSRLKSLRATARAEAINAAKEKAEVYCRAANVSLGKAIHIEDVNPEHLRGREGHSFREIPLDDNAQVQAFNPSSIVVGGAVMVVFELDG